MMFLSHIHYSLLKPSHRSRAEMAFSFITNRTQASVNLSLSLSANTGADATEPGGRRERTWGQTRTNLLPDSLTGIRNVTTERGNDWRRRAHGKDETERNESRTLGGFRAPHPPSALFHTYFFKYPKKRLKPKRFLFYLHVLQNKYFV